MWCLSNTNFVCTRCKGARTGYMDIHVYHGHEVMQSIDSKNNKSTAQPSTPPPSSQPQEAARSRRVSFFEPDIDERENLRTRLLNGERLYNRSKYKGRRASCIEVEEVLSQDGYRENVEHQRERPMLVRSKSLPEGSLMSYLSRKDSPAKPRVSNGYETLAVAELGSNKVSLPSFGDSFRSNTLPRTPKRTNSRTTDGLAKSADTLAPKNTPPSFNTDEPK